MADGLDYDLAIAGGGLAGSLIALAFTRLRPDLRVLLVERDQRLGGNHLWSFFDGDIPAADRWLVEPLVTHRWAQGHAVRFPGHERRLATPYNSIASARLDAHGRQLLGDRLRLGVDIAHVAADHLRLADGGIIRARAVIDARGGGDLSALQCGWQKFVGQALRLRAPHGIDRPVIMDARVEQIDGYRFVYLLPWDARTLFVEDTYYSDTPDLDIAVIEARIAAYVGASGWQVEQMVHRESGVLPVVHGGSFDRFWAREDPVARAGVRAGLFHPMTGYSLPDAVAFARWIVDQPLDGLSAATRARAAAHWRSGGYYRLLGKMLFRAAAPQERWRVFERFYRLPPGLIDRFYAGRSTVGDRIRILCGRPPVPIRSAMRALLSPSAR